MPFSPQREHALVTCAVLAIAVGGTQIALHRSLLHYYQKYMESYAVRWPPTVIPKDELTGPQKHISLVPANLTSYPTDFIFTCAGLGIFAGANAVFRFLAIVNAHTAERDRVARISKGPYADNQDAPPAILLRLLYGS